MTTIDDLPSPERAQAILDVPNVNHDMLMSWSERDTVWRLVNAFHNDNDGWTLDAALRWIASR